MVTSLWHGVPAEGISDVVRRDLARSHCEHQLERGVDGRARDRRRRERVAVRRLDA
ncbi:hypothetical protein [Microbacterium sp. T2.11-28]|uniref:hypothetical protein n=1 Tax=unclassified Microbacterium TaxID=2609290 RepID=UPI002541117D|nr:hypothetical protein [Microbacterium sp. T2.11-28]